MILRDKVCYDLQTYLPEQRAMFISKLKDLAPVWDLPEAFLHSYGIFIYRLNAGESFAYLVVENEEEHKGYLGSFVCIRIPLADPEEILPLCNVDLGKIL